jgi:hypothetical protein
MSLVQQLEPAAEVQPAAGLPAAARILAEAYPQIVDFDPCGMTIEEVHYFLGESAAVAFFQSWSSPSGARPPSGSGAESFRAERFDPSVGPAPPAPRAPCPALPAAAAWRGAVFSFRFRSWPVWRGSAQPIRI